MENKKIKGYKAHSSTTGDGETWYWFDEGVPKIEENK